MAKVPGAANIQRGPSLRDPGVNAPAAAFDLGGAQIQQAGARASARFAEIAAAEQRRHDAIARARAMRDIEQRGTDLLRVMEQAEDPTDPEVQRQFNEGLESYTTERVTQHSSNPDSQAALYGAVQKNLSSFYAQAGTIAATHTRGLLSDQRAEGLASSVNAVARDPSSLYDQLEARREEIELMGDALSPSEQSEAVRQVADSLTGTAMKTLIRRGQHGRVKHLLDTDEDLVELLDPQTIIDLRTELDIFANEERKEDLEMAATIRSAETLFNKPWNQIDVADKAAFMGTNLPNTELVEVVREDGSVVRVPARHAVGLPVPQDTSRDPLVVVVGDDGLPQYLPGSQAVGMQAYQGDQMAAPVPVVGEDGRTTYATREQAIGQPVPQDTPTDKLVQVMGDDGIPVWSRASEAEGRPVVGSTSLVVVEHPDGSRTWETSADARGKGAPEKGALVSIDNTTESARARAFGKAAGEFEAETLKGAVEQGRRAQADLVEIGRIKEASEGGTFQTGSFSDLRRGVAQFARLIGPETAETVEGIVGSAATADTIRAASRKLALNEIPKLGRTLKAGLTLIQETLPDLSVTPEGNRILVEVLERVAQRQIEAATLAETYMRLGTAFPEDGPSYDAALARLEADDPILTDDLRRRIRQGAKFGENVGTATPLGDNVDPELRAQIEQLGMNALPPATHKLNGDEYFTLDGETWWLKDGSAKYQAEGAANE